MKSLRSLIVGTLATVLIAAVAYAGIYNFPFASLTASTTDRTAATLPMTGIECVAGDTYLYGGRAPQTACYTQGNLQGNYQTAITSTNAATIPWSVASNSGIYTLALGSTTQTLAQPTGLVSGQRFSILITQGAQGSKTLTWDGGFAWESRSAAAQPTAPTLTTTAGRADLYTFVVGSKIFGTGASSQNRIP